MESRNRRPERGNGMIGDRMWGNTSHVENGYLSGTPGNAGPPGIIPFQSAFIKQKKTSENSRPSCVAYGDGLLLARLLRPFRGTPLHQFIGHPPQAPMPSQYYSQPTSSVATAPIQIMAPSPKRPVVQSKASPSSTRPVFTPFRMDTSSPI